MPSDSEKSRLPFEPTRKRKKAQKAKASAPSQEASQSKESTRSSSRAKDAREDSSIPEVVSRRMLRRIVIFSGVPVFLGILIFFGSYVIITQQIAELPNVAVLLTTLGCFGLSVIGLSYGALSASWEEDSLGSILGLEQFKLNFGRMVNSWRQARENRRDSL